MRYLQTKTGVCITMQTDKNITERLAKFKNLINCKNIHIIPLRFLCDIVKVNHLIKLDIKIIFTLETDMAKLFETNQQNANIGGPGAQIIWHDTPFI